MNNLELKEYFKYPVETRDKIDEFVNNLNIYIETKYELVDNKNLVKVLSIEESKLAKIKNTIYKFKIENGYKPIKIDIKDNELHIIERTIPNEKEYIELKNQCNKLDVINFSKLNIKDLEYISKDLRKTRKLIYEDLTLNFVKDKISDENINIEDILALIKKMSLLKGYKVKNISLEKRGLIVLEEYVKDDKEFKNLLSDIIQLR